MSCQPPLQDHGRWVCLLEMRSLNHHQTESVCISATQKALTNLEVTGFSALTGKEKDYFDAYGLPPMYSEFRQFLKNYVYNDVQLQEPFSTMCGHYCVLFARYMFAGYSMEQIVCKLEPYTDADIERISLKKLNTL